jgi:hypothetical protein
MAYFNHAFQQTFAPTAFAAESSGEDSTLLIPLEGAFIQADTYNVVTDAVLAAGKTPVMFAMGSPLGSATGVAGAANDILGGNRFHGGYAETWKSKVINPRYVRFIGKQPVVAAATSKVTLEANGECFPCAGDPSIRLDFKGAPILRALNRNGYKILGGQGYCCPDGQTHKDPAKVFAEMGAQLLKDPILSQLVDVALRKDVGGGWVAVTDSATAAGNTRWEKQQAAIAILDAFTADTTVVAGNKGELVITDTSSETVFGDCSFDTRDYYQTEPLQVYASEMDEDGDPCTNGCITISRVKGKSSETKGELILRDTMMYQRYMQHPTNQGNLDSARMREVEKVGPADGSLGITRTADYTCYYILHTVPRFNNPSGTFDNDQYLIKIATNGVTAAWETTLNKLAVGCFGVGSTMTDMSANFLPTEGFPVGNSQGV